MINCNQDKHKSQLLPKLTLPRQERLQYYSINLQATKLFIVTSATREGGGYHPPLDFVLGSRYCIV